MTNYSDIQHMPDIERTYTADDLAQLLRTTRGNIYILCRRGQIPEGVKIGGVRRWPAHQVRAMLGLNKREDEPATEQEKGANNDESKNSRQAGIDETQNGIPREHEKRKERLRRSGC